MNYHLVVTVQLICVMFSGIVYVLILSRQNHAKSNVTIMTMMIIIPLLNPRLEDNYVSVEDCVIITTGMHTKNSAHFSYLKYGPSFYHCRSTHWRLINCDNLRSKPK